MRIELSKHAAESVKNLSERLRLQHGFAPRNHGELVSAFIVELEKDLDEKRLKVLSERSMSQSARRRHLLKMVSEITKNADTEALQTLEGNFKKFKATTNKKSVEIPQKTTVSS